LSIRNQLLFTAGVIVNAGGSTDEIPLSVGSVHRHRQSARERYATEAFNKWITEKPDFPVLHCDSKMFASTTGEKEERLAVIISGSLQGYARNFITFIHVCNS
jgi:hypothetical protein